MRVLQVKVKPSARVQSFSPEDDGTWRAQIKSPPVDGKANEELIALIASHFGVRRAQVRIKSGTSGRLKRVEVDDDGA
jgi:uncharacterized protein